MSQDILRTVTSQTTVLQIDPETLRIVSDSDYSPRRRSRPRGSVIALYQPGGTALLKPALPSLVKDSDIVCSFTPLSMERAKDVLAVGDHLLALTH